MDGVAAGVRGDQLEPGGHEGVPGFGGEVVVQGVGCGVVELQSVGLIEGSRSVCLWACPVCRGTGTLADVNRRE